MANNILVYYIDINECLTYNGGCEYNCTNNNGSYSCSCPSGFTLRTQTGCEGIAAKNSIIVHMLNFVDINECASNNGGCNQSCHNTPGSYYCSCNSGYNLASNGRACNGKVVASSFVIYACRMH